MPASAIARFTAARRRAVSVTSNAAVAAAAVATWFHRPGIFTVPFPAAQKYAWLVSSAVRVRLNCAPRSFTVLKSAAYCEVCCQ